MLACERVRLSEARSENAIQAVTVESLGVAAVADCHREMQPLARREGVGQVCAVGPAAAAERDHGRVVERTGGVDQRSVCRQRAELLRLRKGVGGVAEISTDDRLVGQSEQLARVGQLHAGARGALGQASGGVLSGGAIVESRHAPWRCRAVEWGPAVVIRKVAVVDIGIAAGGGQTAVVDVAGQEQRSGQELRAREIHEIQEIRGEIRRIARLAPVRQHALRRRAVPVETGIRVAVAEVDVGPLVLPAGFAEALPDPRGRQIPPPALVEEGRGQEIVEIAELSAGLAFEGAPTEGAPGGLEPGPGVVMAALGSQQECAAQSIQPEHGIGARHQGHRRDRRLRDQVPVDGVSERLIDPYAVHVDRQAFGRTQQRRGGKAVVVDVHLKRVGGAPAGADTAEAGVQVIGEIQTLLPLHLSAVGRLHVRRYFIRRQAEP